MENSFKFKCNLKQLAMIRTAINYWESREVKATIKFFFLKCNGSDVEEEISCKLKEWTCEVLNNFRDHAALPKPIKNELVYIIIAIGARLVEWLRYICQTTKHVEPYLDTILWTSHGTIDEVKIFKALYINRKIRDTPYMFEEACKYCLKQHVINLWKKSTEEEKQIIQQIISKHNDLNCSDSHLLTDWADYLFGRKPQEATMHKFKLSANGGYENATKYFFRHLKKNEKTQNLVKTAMSLLHNKVIRKYYSGSIRLSNDDYEVESEGNYGKIPSKIEDCNMNRYVDIFVHLMQQLSTPQRNNLLRKYKNEILKTLVTYWPWQGLFMPTLEQSWDYFTDEDYENLIFEIVHLIFDEYRISRTNGTMSILFAMWDRTPVILKKGFVKVAWKFFHRFFDTMEDVSFVKSVINGVDINHRRKELLDTGADTYCHLIFDRKYRIIEKFMEDVLYSDEERLNFKKTIDFSDMLRSFIRIRDYDSANEYLNWQFDTEEEKIGAKNFVKQNNACDIVYDICILGSLFTSDYKKDYFLKWLMYDDRDMENLRCELMKDLRFKQNLTFLFQSRDNERFYEILSMCQFLPAEIEQLKMREIEKLKWENHFSSYRL